MIYAVYDKVTGKINSKVTSNIDALPVISDSEDYIEIPEDTIGAVLSTSKVCLKTLKLIPNDIKPDQSAEDLSRHKLRVAAKLREICELDITNGCISGALGSAYVYPTSQIDQHNLLMAYISKSPAKLHCQDLSGKWQFLTHTKEQIESVFLDVQNHISSCRQKLVTSINDINNMADSLSIINKYDF